MNQVSLLAPAPFPLVGPGDDLAGMILDALAASGLGLESGDVVVVAQKIVSKAEGRTIDLATIEPSEDAIARGRATGKDPRLVEVILRESTRVLRQRAGTMIMEHRLGFVMAHAGVDQSNLAEGEHALALLLPRDPDASAAALRAALLARTGIAVAVVINDSFGRAWRIGTVGVAVGAAGLPAVVDRRGEADLFGRRLHATVIGYADEIAAAASLIMGQAGEGRPVVILRGLEWSHPDAPAASLLRPAAEDMFR